MEYPHGWVEDYQYDSVGQLLNVTDTDPSNNDMKQQKHAYTYDDCGNMTYEYMRGNGTGEATVENTYTYDALHRVISAHENYGNKTRTYQYDSLGNLTYETELGNKSVDYKFNNLNQITKKTEDGWMSQSDFTYDRRGNLIQETYTKNSKVSVTGEYTYDETNKMVLGVNELGESSAYLYNGLGALVENTWVIKKNAYGYHDVSALTNMVAGEVVVDPQTGKKDKKDKLAPEVVAASPELNKTSTVVKQFVVDYTSETFEPLMEYEVNSLEYRYIYGNDRLSVNITGVDTSEGNLIEKVNQIRLYYHMDYLGTADYLTSPMTGKVESWTHYNEWGEITHNAVLKCGQRELDMVKRYATHDYDSVLEMYYAKARLYDAENRRFAAIDPILDGSIYALTFYAKNPVQFVQYLYVKNNPIIYIDQLGKKYTLAEGTMAHATIQTYISSQYEVTIIDKYVYGLTRTTSGKGRPDVVIKNENIYHVYEIKSEEYMGNKRSSKSAFNQLESYVDALKNHPELNTERYTNSSTAQKGTILKWDSHIILPYLADWSKVLEAWTKEANPGMIIYEIRSKKKEDKVKDESFVTESLLNTIRYYAMIACENPPEAKLNLVNVNTYSDKQLNNDIIDWLNDVKIVTTSYGTEVEFPDGKAYYYNPMFPLDMPRISSNSYKELLKIYDGQERRWVNRNTLGDSNTVIPVIPVVPNVPTISLPIFGPSGILVFP
jgi:RHS repeat-associated protein